MLLELAAMLLLGVWATTGREVANSIYARSADERLADSATLDSSTFIVLRSVFRT